MRFTNKVTVFLPFRASANYDNGAVKIYPDGSLEVRDMNDPPMWSEMYAAGKWVRVVNKLTGGIP